MKCRVWTYQFRTIEAVDNVKLFNHIFPYDIVHDTPENWEFLEDMCKRHGEVLERVADR